MRECFVRRDREREGGEEEEKEKGKSERDKTTFILVSGLERELKLNKAL